MEFSKDELRRDLAASRDEQRQSMRHLRDGLARLLDDGSRDSAAERADLIVGGWGRRRFLAVGGLSVATAALVAACGSDSSSDVPQSGIGPSTTALAKHVTTDVTLLRTASSLEHSMIDVYQKALDAGTLDVDVTALAKLFQEQHGEHAAFFEGLTTEAGGEAWTKGNAELQTNVIEPTLKLITAAGNQQTDFVYLTYVLEEVAGGTYQSFVPTFSKPSYRGQVMTVGGVEVRHAATLVKLLPHGNVTPLKAPTSTTTTVAPDVSTTQPPAAIAPAYQVPGPFNPQSAVPVIVGVDEISVALLGPNSFVYE
jgi:hypothetical protein